MINFVVDREKCTKCCECVEDCAYDVIEMSKGYPAVVEDKERECIQCFHCFIVCPTAALSIFGKDPSDSEPLRKEEFPNSEQMESLIKGRRTVRRYKKEPVDPKIIANMLEVLSYSPTSRNNQQLMFTIIDNPETMQKIRHKTMEGIRECLVTDNLPPGLEFYDRLLEAWDKGRDLIFRGAPHMLIVSTPADGPTPMQDTVIALSYFELLAQSMGLGTVWNGLAYNAINAIVPEMKKHLGIPDSHAIGFTMSFGKPAVKYYRTVQKRKAAINKVA